MIISLKISIGLIICVAIIFISGCNVGRAYTAPDTVADSNKKFAYETKGYQKNIEPNELDKWWLNFSDKVTNKLVFEALENNYDLQASTYRLLQSRALLTEATAATMPSVNYQLSGERSKRSFNFGGTGRFSTLNTTFTHNLSVTYVLDIFGKLRHAKRAAYEEFISSQYNRSALINSLIASVITTRVNISTLQKRLDIAKANTQSRQQTLEIVERRYEKGLVSPVDLRLARENYAASKSLEPPLELSYKKALLGLDTLLARVPGETKTMVRTLPELPDLSPVPVGMPVSLLDRRPDLKAAEHALKAANERIGVSMAQLYPDLTFTGLYGFTDDSIENIYQQDETEIYSAIGSLAQPIFNAGQLRAQVDASKARFEELALQYAKTVSNALSEVEEALISDKLLQQQYVYAKQQLDEALAAEDLSKQRYQRGVETILTVLESQRRRRIAEEQLAILKSQLWINRVNLFLALGGDWIGEIQNEQIEVSYDK